MIVHALAIADSPIICRGNQAEWGIRADHNIRILFSAEIAIHAVAHTNSRISHRNGQVEWVV